ncbi:beta-1,3-galactosyltransferase 1-like [Mugil cephalus]|uniref:beta-1,3-galactosyltransferase 1-like n=1 Tax=Mugil cephalus TaxID=48193 RepID=UPI001FB7DC42|nr:beta-1,3-galactosyltransferase 1-like [Mugil cephalus]
MLNFRRLCLRSHRFYFVVFLVFGACFMFYYMDVNEVVPERDFKWIKAVRNHGLNINADNRTDSRSTSEPNTAAESQNMTSTQEADPSTPQQTAHPSVVDQNPAVPDVSLRPYLVEYPYKYNFLMNEPQRCEQEKPFLVLMVPVAPHNRKHRDVIRSTWGGQSSVLGKELRLFFLLGLQTGDGAELLREQLLQESKEHRDLIQSDFLDCYKNLTIKTMVMLEWLDSYCSSASYAMKIDSDMFLNVPNLIKMLLEAPETNYMTGLVEYEGGVCRDKYSKWYIPEELYSEPVLPHYALGLGYVLSLDLPKKLVEASRHVRALYIEDVYLGLCMKHAGIRPTDPPSGNYFHFFPKPYSRCAFSQIVTTTINEYMDRIWLWIDFNRPGPYC